MGMIYDMLGTGEGAAIDMHTLSKTLGINERSCRKAVEAERLSGCMILSSEAGYYKPSEGKAGTEEIMRFRARFEARYRATGKIIQATGKKLKQREKALDSMSEEVVP